MYIKFVPLRTSRTKRHSPKVLVGVFCSHLESSLKALPCLVSPSPFYRMTWYTVDQGEETAMLFDNGFSPQHPLNRLLPSMWNKKYTVTPRISGWHCNHSCQGIGAKSCIFGIPPPPPFFLGVSYMGEGTGGGGTWPTDSEKLVTILNLLSVLRFWQPSYSLATILRICLASSQNSLTLFK